MAGGGFQGGQVIGQTDAHGEEVTSQPVPPIELIGSMYELLGVSPNAKLPHPEGSDVRVMPTAAAGEKPRRSALTAIMVRPEAA